MTESKRVGIEQSLTEELRPIFNQLCEEYRFIAHVQGGFPWVAYKILAELVRGGWRHTEEAEPGSLLAPKNESVK
jgi:hypothetical protein